MKVVNQPVMKKDAMSLVTGKPVFLDDVVPDNALVVKVKRSPYAHALIEEIKIDTALKSNADGVAALQTALASCGNCQIGISTYTGTGTRGEEYPTVITFPKMPTVFFVRGRGTFFAAQGGASEGSLIVYDSGSAQIQDALLSWSGNQLSIVSSNNAKYQLNTDNSLYWVLALYQMDA